jgi:hypothetical protein
MGMYIGEAIQAFKDKTKHIPTLLGGFSVGIPRTRRWYDRPTYQKICTSISADQFSSLNEMVLAAKAPKTYVVERAVREFMNFDDDILWTLEKKLDQFLSATVIRPPEVSLDQLFSDELLANSNR